MTSLVSTLSEDLTRLTTSQNEKPTLLSIPLELRHQIYDYLKTDKEVQGKETYLILAFLDEDRDTCIAMEWRPNQTVRLARSCRQLLHELQDYVFQKQTFRVEPYERKYSRSFPWRLERFWKNVIRRLEFSDGLAFKDTYSSFSVADIDVMNPATYFSYPARSLFRSFHNWPLEDVSFESIASRWGEVDVHFVMNSLLCLANLLPSIRRLSVVYRRVDKRSTTAEKKEHIASFVKAGKNFLNGVFLFQESRSYVDRDGLVDAHWSPEISPEILTFEWLDDYSHSCQESRSYIDGVFNVDGYYKPEIQTFERLEDYSDFGGEAQVIREDFLLVAGLPPIDRSKFTPWKPLVW